MTNAYDHAYQFLKIETPRGLIKGESRDARHKEEIDVYGFSWGMTPTMIKQLRIIKGVDSASTPFASLLHNQTLIKKGVLSLCKVGENLPAYLRLVFEEARVTSLSMRVNDGPGPMLLEELTISFKIYRAEYIRPREEVMGKVFLDTPKPVMVAGIGSALKGLFKGETKADRVDKTPDVPSKPLPAKAPAPRLRTHADMLGKSEGGPGVWGETAKRSKGQVYQEQISKVERGIEYKVKGVNFDGYDPKRKVLVDAKDWEKFPPPNTKFWHENVLKEADGQIKAARGTGAKIEWHVSTKEKAKMISKFLIKNDMDIQVVHTPKL